MNANNFSLLCQMHALVAEMEGMKADNKDRTLRGCMISYGEKDFEYIAAQLRELAQFTTAE